MTIETATCFCGRDHDADKHDNLAAIEALPDVVDLVTIDEDSGSTYSESGDPIILTHHVAIEVYPVGEVWRWSMWSVFFDPWGGWRKGAWNPSGGMARTSELAEADARTALANHVKHTANYGKQIPERFEWDRR